MAARTREGTLGESRDLDCGRIHYGGRGEPPRQMTCQSVQYWLTDEGRNSRILEEEGPLRGHRWGTVVHPHSVAPQVKQHAVSRKLESDDNLQDRSNQLIDLLTLSFVPSPRWK
jgi:hypothetical protein